ncbi:MAG: hypothetical protein A2846_02670 [Candidatus Doudnabacteria bacterium RIFCSPHIGHO2_01_FULL_49_9]|uniref:Multidrug ABC transporter substrate-binding protein n=1 Tax=Candidatus Doudnabacteria bacterium RIFCSPHIGHO2_01_FULL_49_9 TaxID=1817827 RepID=A0A1F5P3H3_9BACT|nr:MAG: hypothetical protein A2846_02670 [Candidatus Doudnabacteria bacterium RIFCSPHIGHO2_01_FULL_49_9]
MLSAFIQSIRGLRRNLTRTALTTLGIIIGIATIILVVAAGEGFRGFINTLVESFGTNAVFVQTRVPPTTRARDAGSTNPAPADALIAVTTLKNRDIETLKTLPNIEDAYGAVIGQQVVSYGQRSKNAFVFGADEARFRIDNGELASGRPYTAAEDAGAEQVAILGADIALDLFGDQGPVGNIIRVGNHNFLIIGVYERRGSFGFSNDDQQIFVPLRTAQKKLLGIDYLFFAIAQTRDPDLSAATAEDMRIALRINHGITDPNKDDFLVQTQEQGLETFDTILAGATFLLIAVASISLLVGGVGIMNIMYVVVTERTPEIGLKKAIGASSQDILREFLVEAVILTLTGGVIGIICGAGLAFVVAKIASQLGLAWEFSVPISGIVLGLGVAGGIGLIFGVFPARSAARLDPIEALRYE